MRWLNSFKYKFVQFETYLKLIELIDGVVSSYSAS